MDPLKPVIIQLSENSKDRLVISKKLGQGGFGTICKARWHGTDLAIKRAKKGRSSQSLKLEVSVLKELQGFLHSDSSHWPSSHSSLGLTHFPRLYHSGTVGHDFFYTMELLGPSLSFDLTLLFLFI